MYQDNDNNDKKNNQIVLPLVQEEEENVVFPLVINVISRYWGEESPVNEIERRLKQYPGFKGTIFIEGLEIIKKEFNLSSIIYKGSLTDIKKRINQGFPLIVVLPGIGDTVQFATIVCGYDEEENRILTYVPEPDSYGAIPVDRFLNEWKQDDFLTMLIFPEDMKEIFKGENFDFEKSNRIYLEAERLKIQGKINDSLNLLNKQLAEDEKNKKENPQILSMIASILNEQNDDKCISIYEKILGLNPDFYLAYRGLGNYYIKNRNYELAQKNYLKAIEINPIRYGSIYKNLAISLSNLGDERSSKDYFRKYLELVPNAADKKQIMEYINS